MCSCVWFLPKHSMSCSECCGQNMADFNGSEYYSICDKKEMLNGEWKLKYFKQEEAKTFIFWKKLRTQVCDHWGDFRKSFIVLHKYQIGSSSAGFKWSEQIVLACKCKRRDHRADICPCRHPEPCEGFTQVSDQPAGTRYQGDTFGLICGVSGIASRQDCS